MSNISKNFRLFVSYFTSIIVSFFVLSSNFNTVSAYHPVDTFVKRGYVLCRQRKEGPYESIQFLENGKFFLYGDIFKTYFLKGEWKKLENNKVLLTFDNNSYSYVCKFCIYAGLNKGFLEWYAPIPLSLFTSSLEWEDGCANWCAALKIIDIDVANNNKNNDKNENTSDGNGVNKIAFPPETEKVAIPIGEYFCTDGTFFGFDFLKEEIAKKAGITRKDYTSWDETTSGGKRFFEKFNELIDEYFVEYWMKNENKVDSDYKHLAPHYYKANKRNTKLLTNITEKIPAVFYRYSEGLYDRGYIKFLGENKGILCGFCTKKSNDADNKENQNTINEPVSYFLKFSWKEIPTRVLLTFITKNSKTITYSAKFNGNNLYIFSCGEMHSNSEKFKDVIFPPIKSANTSRDCYLLSYFNESNSKALRLEKWDAKAVNGQDFMLDAA